MTVRQFLRSTTIPKSAIAKEVGAHISQLYRWEDGTSEPRGRQLARLVLASGHAIKIEAVAGKPLPRNLSILKTA